MEKEKEEFSFWLDKENKVISFHFEKDAEKMDFKSREDAIKLFNRLKELSILNDRFVYGITLSDKVIGFINEVEIIDNTIELGFVIHPDYHNRGFATETLIASIQVLFNMGYTTIKTGVFENNIASQRVMEKAGMKRLPKTESIEYRGGTHNCFLYEINSI